MKDVVRKQNGGRKKNQRFDVFVCQWMTGTGKPEKNIECKKFLQVRKKYEKIRKKF